MSIFKGTPGPWLACEAGDYSDYKGDCIVILGDDKRISVTLGSHEESKANAALIAAAPELLDVLIEIKESIQYTPQCIRTTKALSKAQAVIEKALGND
jgi:hypothetical protein